MSKIEEKKHKVAAKMKGMPGKAGENSKEYRKEMKIGKRNMHFSVEGDAAGTDVYENKFGKSETRKEVKARKEKHGKMPASNWEI